MANSRPKLELESVRTDEQAVLDHPFLRRSCATLMESLKHWQLSVGINLVEELDE